MNIQTDKLLHFAAGTLIGLLCGGWSWCHFGGWAWVAGPLIAAIAGLAKECRDYIAYGTFDFVDLGATIAGGLFGVFALWIY